MSDDNKVSGFLTVERDEDAAEYVLVLHITDDDLFDLLTAEAQVAIAAGTRLAFLNFKFIRESGNVSKTSH